MKILVTGAKGQVGSEIIRGFASTEHEVFACTRKELDCSNLSAVVPVLDAFKPDLIINSAAYTAVDKAEDEPHLAHLINADFVAQLALYCERRTIPLIHLSTDYVFDGIKVGAYKETDLPNPQNVYGQSKYAGEQAIISQLKNHIILRVSWVFGIYGSNFVKTILNLASFRTELNIVSDQWGRPTSAADIARVLLELVQKIDKSDFNEWGIYHYAGEGITNWYEFSCFFINLAKQKGTNLAIKQIHPILSKDYPTKAIRPKNSVLHTEKIEKQLGRSCHPWRDYLFEVIEPTE